MISNEELEKAAAILERFVEREDQRMPSSPLTEPIRILLAAVHTPDGGGGSDPVEPTEAMIEAACLAGCEWGTSWKDSSWDNDGSEGESRRRVRATFEAAYRAMIAAAPLPAAKGGGGEGEGTDWKEAYEAWWCDQTDTPKEGAGNLYSKLSRAAFHAGYRAALPPAPTDGGG